MRENYLAVRDKTVVKANELVQKSRFSLSTLQQKVILYLISQLSPNDEEFKLYEFDIQQFCLATGIDYQSGNNYKLIKEQIKAIRDKSIWVTMPDGTETTLAWIEKPYINARSGLIKIRLDEDMKPYLLQLKENFTQYELIYTLQFKSKYSIRLYELVKSIHFHELEKYTQIYSVDHLKKLLDAETYDTWQHFRDKVLNVAIREINEHSDKQITYEIIKERRAVTKINLIIETKPIDERIRIRSEIDREYRYNPNQFSLFEGKEGAENE